MKQSKWIFMLMLPFLVFHPISAIAAAVQAREGTIDIPTYALGEEDPNPAFPLVNRHQIYPYTMMDDLTTRRQTKTYRAIYLENEFLKAIILPELGGRLYSLYDKTSKREVFYRNNVVKYGLVSLRGAWISGGIEFNFPNGHTVVTVSQVASRLVRNPDGSAKAIVGGMDWVTEMHWEVALTLRPGQARLEQHVTLFNPTPVENLYWYWANAAVPATQDMQFIYPMRKANPHSRTEVWTYPVWDGVDYSWYKDFLQPTSLFGLDVRRNFFGSYYHNSDFGVVHVADYHDVPGKKIWSWGVSGDGLIWTDLLTDHDGAYNEIQSGRYETQLNQEFMPPQHVESWTEYWYPVRGLGGGFVEATNELALNVQYLSSGGIAPPRLELALTPALDIPVATIRVSLAGKLLREIGRVDFKTGTTRKFMLPVADLSEARKSLEVEVSGSNSTSLLHWSAADPIDGNRDIVSRAGAHERMAKPVDEMTSGELFLRGVEQEKDGQALAAAETYKKVLQRDPENVPALLKIAIRQYSSGDLGAAEETVNKAIEKKSDDSAVQYAAGLIHRAAGHSAGAKKAFSAALQPSDPRVPVLIQLGEISISQMKYEEAENYLNQAISADAGDALAFVNLSVALRMGGKAEDAEKAAGKALDMMPLFPLALVEKWRCDAAHGTGESVASQSKEVWKGVLNFDVQNYLEAASWYRRLGDFDSSNAVLEEAEKDFPSGKSSPLVHYYLASNARAQGNLKRADELLAQAASAPCDKVFPQRLSDAQVLEIALGRNPKDAHAHYLLGTFFFAHSRYEDGAREWLAARAQGLDDPVLERDLGVYEWRVKKDLDRSASYYEKAIKLAPNQYRYYADLDDIYSQLADASRREKLFASAPAAVLDRDIIRARTVLLLVQQRQFDQALGILANHNFKPWEGGQVIREINVLVHLEQGRQALQASDNNQAEAAFRQALEYPVNLGVGKPNNPHDEQTWYWLGVALAAEGKRADAEHAWETAVEQGRTAGGAHGVYAAASMIKLGHGEDGERALAAIAERAGAPEAGAQALYAAGLAEQFRDREGDAQADFRRALSIDPQFWQARFELERRAPGAEAGGR